VAKNDKVVSVTHWILGLRLTPLRKDDKVVSVTRWILGLATLGQA
jgi:hypothetical protein